MDRQSLLGWIHVWAFGDCPTFQDPIEFEAKVVMQMRGMLLLNYEGQSLVATGLRAARLGRDAKVALLLIYYKSHAITAAIQIITFCHCPLHSIPRRDLKFAPRKSIRINTLSHSMQEGESPPMAERERVQCPEPVSSCRAAAQGCRLHSVRQPFRHR